MWVVRSFFALEPNLGLEMINVEGLTLRLDHPHRNLRILKVCFIEVKNDVFTSITLIDLGHFQLSIAYNHEIGDVLKR